MTDRWADVGREAVANLLLDLIGADLAVVHAQARAAVRWLAQDCPSLRAANASSMRRYIRPPPSPSTALKPKAA